jgi:hypothetical protein
MHHHQPHTSLEPAAFTPVVAVRKDRFGFRLAKIFIGGRSTVVH